MARIIKIGLAALAVTVGALAVSVATNGINEVHAATVTETDGVKTATITSADLTQVKLENYEFDKGIYDKKFRIPLDNGAYIDGAVIFNDCGHQFVGSTLGDAFGIDNTYDEAPKNAYNFNILFSFEHVTSIGVDLRANVIGNSTNTEEKGLTWLKYASIEGEFYEVLRDRVTYANLVNNPRDGNFYSKASYDVHALPMSTDKEAEANVSCISTGFNIAAFQFTYFDWEHYVTPGFTISAFINSLSFTYRCN